MTDKPARKPRPLTAIQAADKIAIELADLYERIETARTKAADAAQEAVRESSRKACARYMALAPESERAKIAKLLLANETNLHGFDLGGANDTARVGDPLYVSADEIDDAPEEHSGKLSDVAGMDEVPARLREPLSASRLAIGKGHGR